MASHGLEDFLKKKDSWVKLHCFYKGGWVGEKLISVKFKRYFKTVFQPIINSAVTCVGRNSTDVTKNTE